MDRDNLIQIPPWEAGLKPFGVLLLLGCLIFALFAALRGSAQWEIFLRYLNATPFGTQDPLFGRDISFYVFQLPFLKCLYSWLMTVLVLTTLATGGVYFMRRSFQFIPPQTVRVSPPARKHLTFLVAFLFFLGTLGAWIALNEVLYSKRGVVFGPGYTDVNTQVGMFKLLMGATVFCGITILAFAFAYGSDAAPSFLGGAVRTKEYSEATAREIDCAVRALVGRAFERAVEIVARHLGVVERGARILLEKETLEACELDELMSALKPPHIEPGPRRAA